jgi:hypothetical protein
MDDHTMPSMQRMTLQPDDVIVVTVNRIPSVEAADLLRERVHAQFPGHRVLVVDSTVKIQPAGPALLPKCDDPKGKAWAYADACLGEANAPTYTECIATLIRALQRPLAESIRTSIKDLLTRAGV